MSAFTTTKREHGSLTKEQFDAEIEKGMVAIRNCTQELIDMQLEEYSDAAIKEKQAELNTLYDSFSKKYGLINSQTNKRAFNQDRSYCLLCSWEKLDDEGNFKGKCQYLDEITGGKGVTFATGTPKKSKLN